LSKIRKIHFKNFLHDESENVGCRQKDLDLQKLVKISGAEFTSDDQRTVAMKSDSVKGLTALISQKGRIVCIGAKTEKDSKQAAKYFAQILKKNDFTEVNNVTDYKVTNVIGSAMCNFHIKLEDLFYSQSEFAQYEPEIFPGLLYNVPNHTKVRLVIFSSGKVVIRGRDLGEMDQVLSSVYSMLHKFREQ
jgi:transcription initiation factor TFIID TATA-box-binding protein